MEPASGSFSNWGRKSLAFLLVFGFLVGSWAENHRPRSACHHLAQLNGRTAAWLSPGTRINVLVQTDIHSCFICRSHLFLYDTTIFCLFLNVIFAFCYSFSVILHNGNDGLKRKIGFRKAYTSNGITKWKHIRLTILSKTLTWNFTIRCIELIPISEKAGGRPVAPA